MNWNNDKQIIEDGAPPISPLASLAGYPKKRLEIRGVSCPKCNPKLDAPDLIRGYKDSLKYLIFDHFKCRNCGTTLVDVGPQSGRAAEAAFSDNGRTEVSLPAGKPTEGKPQDG